MLGRSRLGINDPDEKYSLKSLPGKFSGLHLLAIMYAAFRQIDPTVDTGVDSQPSTGRRWRCRRDSRCLNDAAACRPA